MDDAPMEGVERKGERVGREEGVGGARVGEKVAEGEAEGLVTQAVRITIPSPPLEYQRPPIPAGWM